MSFLGNKFPGEGSEILVDHCAIFIIHYRFRHSASFYHEIAAWTFVDVLFQVHGFLCNLLFHPTNDSMAEGLRGPSASVSLFFPFFQRCKCHPARGSASRLVDRLFFNQAIGSPDDFERPRVAGVIKFRIFFKFLRFRSHDLARRRVSSPASRHAEDAERKRRSPGVGKTRRKTGERFLANLSQNPRTVTYRSFQESTHFPP